MRSEKLTCEQAKQIDMVDYLASKGYHPTTVKNYDYWFHSPLRNEKTPSFKINRKKNVWYDHGLGKGGNIIDFGILYHRCPVAELLSKLNENPSFQKQAQNFSEPAKSPIKILSEKELGSFSIIRYLSQRKIDKSMALKFCREVKFSVHEKIYSAIGFRNDDGGFELRNQWFKGSASPKTVTTIGKDIQFVAVFEGFFDFLSYLTLTHKQSFPGSNFLILNSISFFEKQRQFMEQHAEIKLFLDNDNQGVKWKEAAMCWSEKYHDESTLYSGYKDLNEWMQHIGKSLNRSLKQ